MGLARTFVVATGDHGSLSMDSDDQLKRKLAAILAADVVGYSHLMGEDE